MLFKTLSELLFAVQLFFLASYTGFAMNLLSVFRNVIFVYAVRKKKPILPWIIVFSLVALATGVTTAVLSWNSSLSSMQERFNSATLVMIFAILVSLLPIAAKITTTFAYACKNPHKLRMINLPSVIAWLIHDIIIFSIAGMSNNVFAIVSITVAEIRFRKIKFEDDKTPTTLNNQGEQSA